MQERSKWFYGSNGDAMLSEAIRQAGILLDTENLDMHPDYLYITLSHDKKTIGVDDVMPIVEKGNVKPVLAHKSVVIINPMDKLTLQAQNKLLTTIESSPYLCLIGICTRDTLLDTVKSRLEKVEFRSIGRDAFKKSIASHNLTPEDEEILFHATSGNPCLVDGLVEHISLFRELSYTCSNGKLKDLLGILHLLKEKDALAVTNNKDLLTASIRTMTVSLISRAMEVLNTPYGVIYAEAGSMLLEEEQLVYKNNYSKEHFFITLVKIIEELEETKNGTI